MPYTIHLHRVLKAPPAKVYRAFLEPDAMCKWLPPGGFTCRVHQLDAKVGGTFRMSFTNFSTGRAETFGGTYLEMVPDRRLVYTDTFDDPNLPGEITVTIDLAEVFCGTDLKISQAGLPDVIPEAACHLGWQDSLTQLAALVEPDISE